MRIGFALGPDGFAAVLYQRMRADGTLDGATTRTPWSNDLALVMAWGDVWAQRLNVPLDTVRVSTTFLVTPDAPAPAEGDDHAR